MFTINGLENTEPLSIYLSRPSEELITCLDEFIDENSASMVRGINQPYELDFTVYERDGENKLEYYDYIQEGMYLFVEKIGLFKMKQPSIHTDGDKSYKDVKAYSCESELEDKNCSLSFNTGESTSMEYLVEYDEGETELLVNPYTNIPYDWIVLHNTFPAQLQIEYNRVKDYTTEVVVTDTDRITELMALFTLIPRLKNKMTPDDNGDYVLTEYAIVKYDDDDTEVVSITLTADYKNRVLSLIDFYNKYGDQLSLITLALDNTNTVWSVGDIYGVSDGDYTLANKKYQFEADENIYSFLTNTLSQTTECIVSFDILNRKVNLTPIAKIGEDTGIVMSYENLVNSLDISCSEDTLATRLKVTGGDDLGVEQVNFGSDKVEDLSYKLNAKDSNGNRIYASEALATAYQSFLDYRESRRDEYIALAKQYIELNEKIYELQYRVPNDDLNTDWGTYSTDLLNELLTEYKNLLVSLKTLYKEDYASHLNPDGSINENHLKITEYWYDYEAYNDIIEQIECAISTYPYYNDKSKWNADQKSTYSDVDDWQYDWTLYGTIELNAKIATYQSSMNALLDNGSVIAEDRSTGYAVKKVSEMTDTELESFGLNKDVLYIQSTDPSSSWSDETYTLLTSKPSDWTTNYIEYYVKSGSTYKKNTSTEWAEDTYYSISTKLGYIWYDISTDKTYIRVKNSAQNRYLWQEYDSNYQYDVYMEYYNHYISAKNYLDNTLTPQLTAAQSSLETVQDTRTEIVKAVQMENSSYLTADDCKEIYKLLRDADYNNENILVTSIDTYNQQVETMLELLEDGQEELSKLSRPQLEFSVDADNLLGLQEFKEFWDKFEVGNYMMVQYKDDTYVKLRMVGYKFNPSLPTSSTFEITFSNQIRSKAGVSDLEYLLGSSVSSGGGGSSSGGGSGDGYGESDDIDVTISNTMLAKLLSSETFGTRVKDVILDTIDVNSLTAKYAKFNGLARGTTTIDGACIKTGIITSHNYNGATNELSTGGKTYQIDNTEGSILKLDDGTFNYAGGSLKFDGTTLSVIIGDKNSSSSVNLNSCLTFDAENGLKLQKYLGDPSYVQLTSSQVNVAVNDDVVATFGSYVTVGSRTEGCTIGENGSFVVGTECVASNDYQTVLGHYNYVASDGTVPDSVLTIGNGTANNKRSDVFRVCTNGDVRIKGQLIVGCSDDMESGKTVEDEIEEKVVTLKSLMAVLSNENQTLTADSEGKVSDFTEATTTIQVYYGSDDVTDECKSISATTSNVTGDWVRDASGAATHTYQINDFDDDADNGYVDFQVSYVASTETTLIQTIRFNLSKAKAGEEGSAKSITIMPSALIFKSTDDTTYSPDNITLTPTVQNCSYKGWQYYDTANSKWTDITSDGDKGHTIGTDNVLTITNDCEYFGTSVTAVSFKCLSDDDNIYDVTTLSKVSDGAQGNGIESEEVMYAISSSNTTPPTSGWVTKEQGIPSGTQECPYLWTRTVYTYNDKTTSIPSYTVTYSLDLSDTFIDIRTLYYYSTTHQKPDAPSTVRSTWNTWTTSQTANEWITVVPPPNEKGKAAYYYWSCSIRKPVSGSLTITPVTEYADSTSLDGIITATYINTLGITASSIYVGRGTSSETTITGDSIQYDISGAEQVAKKYITTTADKNGIMLTPDTTDTDSYYYTSIKNDGMHIYDNSDNAVASFNNSSMKIGLTTVAIGDYSSSIGGIISKTVDYEGEDRKQGYSPVTYTPKFEAAGSYSDDFKLTEESYGPIYFRSINNVPQSTYYSIEHNNYIEYEKFENSDYIYLIDANEKVHIFKISSFEYQETLPRTYGYPIISITLDESGDPFPVGLASLTNLIYPMPGALKKGAINFGPNYVTGEYAFSNGYICESSGNYAYSEGYYNSAYGSSSHVEGAYCKANGNYSHAEGHTTTALGKYSHASGLFTIAKEDYQTAIGCYNAQASETVNHYILTIGNGDSSSRSNALAITRQGKIILSDKGYAYGTSAPGSAIKYPEAGEIYFQITS